MRSEVCKGHLCISVTISSGDGCKSHVFTINHANKIKHCCCRCEASFVGGDLEDRSGRKAAGERLVGKTHVEYF